MSRKTLSGKGARHAGGGGGGGGLDVATTAWVNAVVAAGGAVSAGRKTVVDTLVTSLKGHGLFSKLDRLWLLASENAQQRQIDLINRQTWTSHGTGTFTTDRGYAGDGSTGYLDGNFIPSTAGGNWTANSGMIGVYVRTSDTTGQNMCEIGVTSDVDHKAARLYPHFTDGLIYAEMDGQWQNGSTSGGNAQGMWVNTRNGDPNLSTLYRNGSSLFANGTTVAGLPEFTMVIGATNAVGSIVSFSSHQIALAYWGSGFSATEVANFTSDCNAYMTSLGANVF